MLRSWFHLIHLQTAALILSIGLSSLASSRAFAQEPQSKTQTKPKKGSAAKAPSKDQQDKISNNRDESAKFIRKKRPFGVEAIVTPLSDWALTYGGRAFYGYDSSTQMMGQFLMGTLNLDRVLPKLEGVSRTGTFSGRAAMGEIRYFVSETFAVTGGLGNRRGILKISVSDDQQNVINTVQTISTIDAGLAVGNYWLWSNGFMIGCDWIGVLTPVSSSFESTFSSNLDDLAAEEDLVKRLNDNLSKISRKPIFTLGLFSIGYSF